MAQAAERVLGHAVRIPVVSRYVGELGLALGGMGLVPTLCAVVVGDTHLIGPYGVNTAILLGLGFAARRVRPPHELQANEALVVTVLVFLLSPLLLSVPLVAQGIPWIDALFEAISGVTTTGLSTLETVEGRSRTFLFARAWTQWVGGLGFVVLSLALLLDSGVATRRLGAQSLDPGDFVGSIRVHARRVLAVYISLTLVGVVTLLLAGADLFDAVVHTLASVSTGGFAPRDASLAELAVPLQHAILAVSFLGAISLPLYAVAYRGQWRLLRDDAEARALVVAIAVVGLVLVVVGGSAAQASVSGPSISLSDWVLLSVSAQTTTGFATFPLAELPDVAKATLVGSMLTGGSLGSTAGGVKLVRVLLMVRLVQWLIAQTRLPAHAVSAPSLAGTRLEAPELFHASAMVFVFVGVVVASWLPFLAYGYAPLDALFEVSSATGTVGLSVGLSRPELEPLLKGVLCLDMVLGRLEVLAVLVFLAPRTWLGRRAG